MFHLIGWEDEEGAWVGRTWMIGTHKQCLRAGNNLSMLFPEVRFEVIDVRDLQLV